MCRPDMQQNQHDQPDPRRNYQINSRLPLQKMPVTIDDLPAQKNLQVADQMGHDEQKKAPAPVAAMTNFLPTEDVKTNS